MGGRDVLRPLTHPSDPRTSSFPTTPYLGISRSSGTSRDCRLRAKVVSKVVRRQRLPPTVAWESPAADSPKMSASYMIVAIMREGKIMTQSTTLQIQGLNELELAGNGHPTDRDRKDGSARHCRRPCCMASQRPQGKEKKAIQLRTEQRNNSTRIRHQR